MYITLQMLQDFTCYLLCMNATLTVSTFSQAKHLQFVGGVDAISFWLATYSWDFINYLFPMFGILIMFAAFQVDSLKEDLGAIFLLLVIIISNCCLIQVII